MTEPRKATPARIAALIAGVLILAVASLVSVGMALAAPLGIFVMHRIQRARGRRLGGWESWVGAVGGVTLALMLAGSVLTTNLPAGTLNRLRQTADSASAKAAKEPPPAWIGRIAPSANRYSGGQSPYQSTLNAAVLLWGVIIAAGLLGGIVGTMGWAGSTLLLFYAKGRWFGAPLPMMEFEPTLHTVDPTLP